MEKTSIDILWILTASALVFVMRAGFAMLESGIVRSKNSINVSVKVLSDLAISLVVFWPIGFGIMFGSSWHGLIGTNFYFPHLSGMYISVFFLFHAMFTSTSATIVSGAVAERIKYPAYLIITLIFSAVIYPVFGHWAWNNGISGSTPGWLVKLGFIDFAGSTVVHSIGGWMSAAVILILGPRIGRYNEDGSVNRVTGSNTQTAVVGTILLWFGWIGFNGGSTLAMNDAVPGIIVNTCLSGAAGFVVTLIAGWYIRGFADVGLVVNGTLAGLVAVTASCAYVNEWQSMVIGAIGGLVMLLVEWLIDRLKIDDAVGAIPVHLGAGIWGTLAVGLFSDMKLLGTNLTRIQQTGVQLAGILAAAVWAFGVAFIVIWTINRIFPIRVKPEDEYQGLNISEHRASTEIYDLYNSLEEQARTGDLSIRIHEEPFTEMGQIARRYNQVIATLEENLVAKSDYVSILDNVSDGLFLMDRDNRIAPHYSGSLEKIFEQTSLAGISFDKLLDGLVSEKDLNSFKEYSLMLFDSKFSFRTLEKLNPLKKIGIFIDDRKGGFLSKHIECSFLRITENNTISRVMAIVRDVTAETELTSEMEKVKERSQREMQMFYRILRIEPAMFIEFLSNLEENISKINEILEFEKGSLVEMLNEMYRYVHSIKGDANLFELDFLAQKAHNFESRIEELLQNTSLENADFIPLAVMVSELHSTVTQMQLLIEQILSFQKDFSSHNNSSEELIVFSVKNTINRLTGKTGKIITIDSSGFDILNIPVNLRKKVKEIFIQLARNSVIHGIETPEERIAAGKNHTGQIKLSAIKKDDCVVISYSDDGRGIDFENLGKSAAGTGQRPDSEVSPASRKKLIELMFQPGVSTSETADLDSGRGIGMFLVRRTIAELNGRITVKTRKGEFCEFEFAIPCA